LSIDISGISTSDSLHAMSGASAGMPPQQKMTSLFNKIDTNGSGSITQAQLDQAFQSFNPPAVFQQQGAEAIFAALDPNGTGSVSKQDFVSGMSSMMASLRADPGAGASGPSPSDTLASSLQFLNALDPSSVPANAQPGTLLNTAA
jgi:EF hand domain-containing protein